MLPLAEGREAAGSRCPFREHVSGASFGVVVGGSVRAQFLALVL